MNQGNRNNWGKNENNIESQVPAINSILFPISGGANFKPRDREISNRNGDIREPSMK